MRVPIPGYADTALVTGRGNDAAEAARNLTETIQATKAALAPGEKREARSEKQEDRSREQIVAGLLTCGMQKAVAKGDMGLVERLAKAAALVLGDRIQTTDTPDVYRVLSLTNDTHYLVVATALTCTCPDWHKHNGEAQEKRHLCKHVLATIMDQRVQAELAPTPQPPLWEHVANPATHNGSYHGRTLVNGK